MLLVDADDGDCLCTVAHRYGFSNCSPLRALAQNRHLLDSILTDGDQVSVPEAGEGGLAAVIASGKRHVFSCCMPTVPPVPARVWFVRTPLGAPGDVDRIQNIGISRFAPPCTDMTGLDKFPDHTERGPNANAIGDPNAFNIEVIDDNTGARDVSVWIEAMMPVYTFGTLTNHAQFPAGAVRNARSLRVTCSRMAADGSRRRSCYLRLVVDDNDKGMRPEQTLLVTDMVESGQPDVEILDQNIRVTYAYSGCPEQEGNKCVLARDQIELRRGRSVGIEARILRAVPDGTANDNGFVQRQHVYDRIMRNCRRIWAQEELTFTIHRRETVDQPCDMLTVGDPAGDDASGHQPRSAVQGQVGLTITIHPFVSGAPTNLVLGPLVINGGDSPTVTAGLIQQAIAAAGHGLAAHVSSCAPEGAAAQGSADIIISCTTGHASVSAISPDTQQDSAQLVQKIEFNINQVSDEQPCSQSRKGGPPMRRQLFKAYPINPQRLNIFVVKESRGGLTTSALDYLPGHRADADVGNCISMNADHMTEELDSYPLTLPHEIGHALVDADHTDWGENGSLMMPGQSMGGHNDDTKRVSGPGHNETILRVSDAAAVWREPPVGPLGIAAVNTDLHQLIAGNGSLTFLNR